MHKGNTFGTHVVLWLLLSVFLTSALIADAEQLKRTPRIGYLSLGSAPAEPEAAFKQQLRDLGWIEGQNLAIDYRWAANDITRLAVLAEELVRRPVDLLVVSSTPVIQAA